MAEKRMFSKRITESDAFMSMPDSTQNLYFHLSMNADDDGFVDKPKAIMRMIGAKEDDLKVLITKAFLIPFESGIVVIKHWRINNILRSDRYNETTYINEKSQLNVKENGAYSTKNAIVVDQRYTNGIPMVDQRLPQYSIDKIRLDKSSIDKNDRGEQVADSQAEKLKKFIKPTAEEVQAFCLENNYNVDANRFVNFYESKGWLVGKTKMKDWKAALRGWESRNNPTAKPIAKKTKWDDRVD